MEMIAHQTIGEQGEGGFLLQFRKRGQKQFTITLVDKRFPSVDTTGHRMIDGSGIMYSWSSSHL
ncbi:MAG: hypothetical protein A2X40_00625 [Elusimicrobia bacterium GWC2_65_9]|nr:MAG: hypothetical protein A2X37_05645 [Elusimicrobia bacterium GWA2_66_18]OGR75690.1 MAG: hypothetical protein A2X40_00625 [Elusimicrobia bacterium GWC2_65_9]